MGLDSICSQDLKKCARDVNGLIQFAQDLGKCVQDLLEGLRNRVLE